MCEGENSADHDFLTCEPWEWRGRQATETHLSSKCLLKTTHDFPTSSLPSVRVSESVTKNPDQLKQGRFRVLHATSDCGSKVTTI